MPRSARRPGPTRPAVPPGGAAPALDRQVELRDEPVRERRGRQPGQPHRRLAAAHLDPRARRQVDRAAPSHHRTPAPSFSGSTSTASRELGPTTSGRANSAWALMGTSSIASTSGHTTGPARRERVRRGAGGRGHHDPVAAPRRQRPAVDLDSASSSIRSRDAFSTLTSFSAQDAPPPRRPCDAHIEGHPLLDRVVAGHDPLDGGAEVLALGLGQEADVAEVDPEQRCVGAPGHLRAAQDRAVAAEDADQLAVAGGRRPGRPR